MEQKEAPVFTDLTKQGEPLKVYNFTPDIIKLPNGVELESHLDLLNDAEKAVVNYAFDIENDCGISGKGGYLIHLKERFNPEVKGEALFNLCKRLNDEKAIGIITRSTMDSYWSAMLIDGSDIMKVMPNLFTCENGFFFSY